jgi:hypothetical protein
MKCKLCQLENELCDSHIIPEFFYDPLYDNNHRIKRISFDPSINIKRIFEQKGLREKLLCKNCECILNIYETYACEIWRNQLLNISNQFNYLNRIDYQKFKLFLISIIWRCGITTNAHFNIDLGLHQEKMREMLLNNNPGNFDEYGCLISAMVNDNDELIDDLIWLETDFRIEGHRCYRLLFGGFIWIFFISSHKPPEIALKSFLQNSGDLLIMKANLSDIDFMMKHAEKLFL